MITETFDALTEEDQHIGGPKRSKLGMDRRCHVQKAWAMTISVYSLLAHTEKYCTVPSTLSYAFQIVRSYFFFFLVDQIKSLSILHGYLSNVFNEKMLLVQTFFSLRVL